MITDTEIMARLERLERDNRRLKKLSVVVLVLAAALGTIYATRPVPQEITAHEFDVVDPAGKIQIRVGTPHIRNAWPGITVFSQNGKVDTVIGRGGLTFFGARGAVASLTTAAGAELDLLGGKPSITLHDSQGFDLDLGATQTIIQRTGRTQNTSAASIVMFGNDKKHHVIWEAP